MSRILIVEDHVSLLRNLKRGLELLHYEIHGAATGEEAIQLALAKPLDLVILDLMLPGKSGFDVLEHLRSTGFNKPVLILTARDAPQDRQRGYSLGANGFLIKPFAFSELAAAIKALLREPRGTTGSDEAPLCVD